MATNLSDVAKLKASLIQFHQRVLYSNAGLSLRAMCLIWILDKNTTYEEWVAIKKWLSKQSK